jgi:hypothetical protein
MWNHNPLEEWRRNEAAPRRLPSVLKQFPMVSFLYPAVVFVVLIAFALLVAALVLHMAGAKKKIKHFCDSALCGL